MGAALLIHKNQNQFKSTRRFRMKKVLSLLLCLAVVLSLLLPVSALAVVKVTGISLDKASITLTVGQADALTVRFAPANTTQKLLSYSTSNKNVASVDANGRVTAVNAGKAVITVASVSDKSITAKCNVTVTASKSKPVTLTVEVFDRGVQGQPDLNNNQWTRYINNNFGKANNVKVNFVPVIRTQEVDKLNILMAAGDAPDVSFIYDQATVNKYVKNDSIIQLDDLLAKYGPTLRSYLGETILKYGLVGGKQMVIPAKRNMVPQNVAFIRQDWLDALGLPLPTTKDELYNTLVAFRDKNPGKVSGVIPWATAVSGSGSMYNYGNIFEASWGRMTEQEYAATPGWKRPGNKEALRFLNKLYNEKLLSPDLAIDKTGKQADGDVTNGKAGFFCSLWDYPYRLSPGIYTTLKKNVPTAVLTPVDTFKNYAGKYLKSVWPPYGMFIMIPKTSKNAEQAMKYIDWLAKPETLFYLQNGEEGVNHKLVNGLPQGIPQTGDKMMPSSLNIDYEFVVNGAELNDPAKNDKLVTMSYTGNEDGAAKSLAIGVKDGLTPFFFDTPNEASIKYSKTLGDKNTEMTAKLIYCRPSEFDVLYANLVEEYMSAGGQAVMDENIKIYKAMKAVGKK
jgi:putative aldouronate transport system substrate-binding protein